MDNQFAFKQFEKVRIKATYTIEIGGKEIFPGETIAMFDKIQIAGLNQIVTTVAATGGYDNRSHVFWESVREQDLIFSQGIFSEKQFALLMNSNFVKSDNSNILITETEYLESDENGVIELAHNPIGDFYIYNVNTGEKITTFSFVNNKIYTFSPYTEFKIDYVYNYIEKTKTYYLGGQLISGFVEIEGRTKIKDDTTGRVVTGILKIPKVKLMSSPTIVLGDKATPTLGSFKCKCIPVGERHDSYVSEFVFLNDDIDSDM